MADHIVQAAVMRHDGRTYTKGDTLDLDTEQAKRYQDKGWTVPKSQARKDDNTGEVGQQVSPTLPSDALTPAHEHAEQGPRRTQKGGR